MQESEAAKLGVIRAYFDEEERKVARLTELASCGYSEEGFVLCLVYIDRVAQKLCWPSAMTGRNFVMALAEFGQDAELGLVHPKQLAAELRRLKAAWQPIAGAIEGQFPGPSYELRAPTEIEAALTPSLNQQERAMLHDELWRGAIAAVAYFWLRNPAVHGVGAPRLLTFSGTTVTGTPARPLDFPRLAATLPHLVAEARRRSEAVNQWYGDDRILA